MHFKTILALFVTIFLSHTLAASEIYSCGQGDDIVFQDEPCNDDYDYGLENIDTVDGWKYGMNILAFKKEVTRRGLAINPGNSLITSQHDESFANSDPFSRTYSYQSIIVGKKTKVTLFFTETTQKLYQIKVDFDVLPLPVEAKNYFYAGLVKQFSEKYGQYLEMKDYPPSSDFLATVVIKDLVGTEKIWGWETANVISLTGEGASAAIYELNYIYLPLAQQNKVETTRSIPSTTDKVLIQDMTNNSRGLNQMDISPGTTH